LPENVPQFLKDYHAYYKTPRGYHVRSLNSNGGWTVTAGNVSLPNTNPYDQKDVNPFSRVEDFIKEKSKAQNTGFLRQRLRFLI